jgi:hypothetical protein
MIRKSVQRFSEKIMLNQESRARLPAPHLRRNTLNWNDCTAPQGVT